VTPDSETLYITLKGADVRTRKAGVTASYTSRVHRFIDGAES
jgi:hypothetical protein